MHAPYFIDYEMSSMIKSFIILRATKGNTLPIKFDAIIYLPEFYFIINDLLKTYAHRFYHISPFCVWKRDNVN